MRSSLVLRSAITRLKVVEDFIRATSIRIGKKHVATMPLHRMMTATFAYRSYPWILVVGVAFATLVSYFGLGPDTTLKEARWPITTAWFILLTSAGLYPEPRVGRWSRCWQRGASGSPSRCEVSARTYSGVGWIRSGGPAMRSNDTHRGASPPWRCQWQRAMFMVRAAVGPTVRRRGRSAKAPEDLPHHAC